MDKSEIGVVKRWGRNPKSIVNHKTRSPEDIERLFEDAWLGLDIRDDELYNPLEFIPQSFEEDCHLYITWLMTRPEYLAIFCKEIMNVNLFPIQALAIQELWTHKFPLFIATRGFSKSYSLAVYSMLRAIMYPGCKIIIVGAAFRQSKIIYEYLEGIYRNAPLLKDMIAGGKRDDQIMVHDSSMWTFKVGDSKIMCIPMGSGDTIRGLRANLIICDEMMSINRHIFENVVAGFGVVSSSPIENIKKAARKKLKKDLNLDIELIEEKDDRYSSNQIILSGTAYYKFNHFYDYFSKYREIIRSMGDRERLRKIVGDEIDNPAFDWRDYAIIRIPYHILPPGYMEESQVSRSKVSVSASNFMCEYGAVFASDSDGFFRRTLIESCVPSEQNKIMVGTSKIDFNPRLEGNSQCRYVYAIDPASETDNFALIIIELRDDHRRIVYSWTTNKSLHKRHLVTRHSDEDNYWAFCIRKVRNLMKVFPCIAIVVDSQGGGNAVREAFHDKDKMQNGEQMIWPIFNENKPDYSDTQDGLHIIHMVNFADNNWLSNAYFNTRKDMQEKLLLFPSFDGATIGLTECTDEKFIEGGLDDNLENLVEEIEELKNELTCIIHSKTEAGRDKFSVPDAKTAEGKKSRVRKDRASALIMGNAIARSIMRDYIDTNYEANGGFATPIKETKGLLYSNPWYAKAVGDAYMDL